MAGTRDYHLAVLFILLDVLFWGFSFISTKVVLSQIPPISIALFRQIIAVMTLIILLTLTGTKLKIARRDAGYIVLASFFGIVMYFVLENTGLLYTTASNASMIVASLPIFTIFAEALLFRLRVTGGMILCLILSTIGVALVVTVDGRLDLSSLRLWGNLLVMGAIISWVIYTILNRRLSESYPSLTLTTFQSAASIILFIPLVIPEMGRWPAASEISLYSIRQSALPWGLLLRLCLRILHLCLKKAGTDSRLRLFEPHSSGDGDLRPSPLAGYPFLDAGPGHGTDNDCDILPEPAHEGNENSDLKERNQKANPPNVRSV